MLPSILAKQLRKIVGDYVETTSPMTSALFSGSSRILLETKDVDYYALALFGRCDCGQDCETACSVLAWMQEGGKSND